MKLRFNPLLNKCFTVKFHYLQAENDKWQIFSKILIRMSFCQQSHHLKIHLILQSNDKNSFCFIEKRPVA
jgi:hypothetical protein